jgi:hypothetical protein
MNRLVLVLVLGLSVAAVAQPALELNTDRPGNDLRWFELPEPKPELCRAACLREPACNAFTYVRPFQHVDPPARCYLKGVVPLARADGCCVSGLKSPLPVGMEEHTERPGGDLKGVDLAEPRPELCRAACDAEPECKAYTYVRPGVQGPAPRCLLKAEVPEAQANTCCVSGVKPQLPAGLEAYTDRPGSDWKSFDLKAPRPELCRAACDAASACKAYTYVKPGLHGPTARCFLKSVVPEARPNICCVSGVKPPLPAGMEDNTDRPGSDVKSFDLPEPRPELCRAACEEEPACKAFTYMRPDVQSTRARCFLKAAVLPARPNTCCAAGVKSSPKPGPTR